MPDPSPTLKIPFARRMRILYLIMGTLWTALALGKVFTKGGEPWLDYGFVVIALMHLVAFFWYWKGTYVRVAGGQIIEFGLVRKQLRLSDIVEARLFAGELILRSADLKMRLNLQLMDSQYRERLLEELKAAVPAAWADA